MSRQLLSEARDLLAEIIEDEKPAFFEALDLETTVQTDLGQRIELLLERLDVELDKSLLERLIRK
jgi:hypothetical protein